MPNQNTYYSDRELEEIERQAEEQGKSFSKIVREAVQEHYDL